MSSIFSFKVSFLNKCDETEKPIITEYFQRVFNIDLDKNKKDNLKKK